MNDKESRYIPFKVNRGGYQDPSSSGNRAKWDEVTVMIVSSDEMIHRVLPDEKTPDIAQVAVELSPSLHS